MALPRHMRALHVHTGRMMFYLCPFFGTEALADRFYFDKFWHADEQYP